MHQVTEPDKFARRLSASVPSELAPVLLEILGDETTVAIVRLVLTTQ
jgi:hypothetical protein